ncbi:nucleoid DNA-binding protein [Amphritea atlantica]|uniref:Nucleoid DNA-binding protein n=1 Tax=Amphritea atlantica TaxID=355243 RepID=A0A1H9EES0_9GAMM|nr:HU family DNA-binding protein [Amphritea atlantica]SEQ24135.1 nucleoid DNA-binding protein [Amphritea atlantica]
MSIVTAEQMASHVAFCARLSPVQAKSAIEAVGSVILQHLAQGHTVAIDGFGLFEVALKDDGTKGVRFRQAKKMREAING